MPQLHVRGLNSHVLEVIPGQSVGDVKQMLAQAESFDPAVPLVLWCEGHMLTDEQSVLELSSNELDLTVGLLGGKVHGSLARAGKVKGQTPKVEKKEKKKKKTGRAKRRIQYNRRFSSVVQAYGRRRGPNANSA
ncbi:ubiquitin-like FUBI-ribosomal protein eS30 fusion protein [Anopheles bellator]|uniref:ubiquitin-like FUBI-ribosomal protein eS30 fusion protein n=1 Tax=Anopheles bellator TaxID=139047 RepID=UPI002648F414|nr:ubiquitin-like FUBI-ribosomal protein eS30 fusion protein [Anopheles bellator]